MRGRIGITSLRVGQIRVGQMTIRLHDITLVLSLISVILRCRLFWLGEDRLGIGLVRDRFG